MDLRSDVARRESVEEDDSRGDRPLKCRACGNEVTSRDQTIEVDGSHVHTRLNPANVVFRFGCYRLAPGCRTSGSPSREHVWFTGCLWQYAHCTRCAMHLGWAFSGAQEFFGLVLERLTEP